MSSSVSPTVGDGVLPVLGHPPGDCVFSFIETFQWNPGAVAGSDDDLVLAALEGAQRALATSIRAQLTDWFAAEPSLTSEIIPSHPGEKP